MSEEQNTANAAAADQVNPQATMSLQRLYLKDLSFETPNSPGIFAEQGQPDIKLNLNQKVQKLDEENYEVNLAVTVTCKVNEKTAYLVEVQQAGIFNLKNFGDQLLHQILGAYCPNVLFPYARQKVSELVSNGGFQPLMLQPVNFDQLYAEQMQKAQQQASTETTQ